MFSLVAVAASLGGPKALTAVLAPLPADFPAAIVVVQHLSARYPSSLVEILDRRTALAVQWAAPGERVRPGTTYVAPPDHHVLFTPDGTLALSHLPPVHFTRPAADLLFASVAATYGEHTIGVVLTGAGCDGAAGIRAIKEHGGRVLIQDEATARAREMPRAALATGCGDFALPLHLIAPALIALVMVPGAAALLRVAPTERPRRPAIGTPGGVPAG
jgi:two-component system chemotaxis response regulator CheB